jgi:hypothetical protein
VTRQLPAAERVSDVEKWLELFSVTLFVAIVAK